MIDADLRTYLKGVQGEEPPLRLGEPRWAETEAVGRRLIEKSAAEGALKSLEQEPARKKRWDLLLLTALLNLGLGERARALDALEVVADKLLAAGDREGVRALLPRFLEPEPTPAAVRFLHFLASGDAPDEQRIEWLRTALEIRPADPELHEDLARLLERPPNEAPDEAREHRLRALELSLDDGSASPIGDAVFRAVDEDLDHAPARVGRILLRYAATADWSDAEPMLDLAIPTLETRAPGRFSWDDVAPIGRRLPGTRDARALFARLFRVAIAKEPDPDAIVQGSGILDVTVAFDTVASRVPKIAALPPGAHVSHQTWGMGRVLQSDGETLTLDFPGRTGHKMSVAMATRSLDRLPSDGLRVLALEDPAKAKALAEEGHPEILVRALRDIGGSATQAQLKPKLDAALPGFDWSVFWKRSKERLKAEPRLDTNEAYRGQFRLAAEGSEAEAPVATLPRLAPRAPGQGLQLIRKFLRDHPEDVARLTTTAGPLVVRWADDPRLDSTMRAQALCHALSWRAIDESRARRVLDDLIAEGLGPDDLALGTSQEQLLELSRGASREEEFLWQAVESRLPRLRDQGRERLRALLQPERFARAVEQRLARAADQPGLATRLIEHFAARPDDAGAPSQEALLLGAVRLLEGDLPEGAPERLQALLTEDGPLHARFRATPLSTETAEALERTVLHWAGSERRLVPVLEVLHAIGLGALGDEYERRRRARAQGLLEGRSTEDVDTQFTLMTRATYDRLQEELQKTARELKTSIPAAIEKARALGDLKENAEYHAAKERQANTATRVQELMKMIQRARLIENLEIEASRVGVGTETTLRPSEENGTPGITFWILGEGDGNIAPGVLSYRAPLARPLLGKEVGAEVELEMPEGPRRYRVESIRRRLPGDPASI